ncbi:MAG: type 4a pilus biogenesis protein PilO [Planctomycetota bacterium]
MSRLNEKQLLLLTIGVTVLILGGLGWLIWSDLQAVEEEEDKIDQLKQRIAAAETEIATIPEREARVIADREIADREVAFLPSEEDIESFWDVLERFADESGVRISEISPSRGSGRAKKGPIQTVPQVLTVRGTVDEFIRFINLVENYDRIINVKEYSISSGRDADEDGKIRHGIQLALTTFTYSKKIANTIVSIPQYEKKRQLPEVKRWLSKIKIQEKESYTLRTSLGRRDPFVNARREADTSDGPEAGADRERAEALLEGLSESIRTLIADLDVEDELRARKDIFRLAQQVKENRESVHVLSRRIDQMRQEKIFRDPRLSERFTAEVLEPFESIRERIQARDDEQPPMPLSEVKARYETIAKAFDERKWPEVRKGVRSFLDLTREGQHVSEEARTLVEKIVDFQRRSDVIREFAKQKIEITAIIYSPNALSLAIINGKTKSEGDALDTDGRVVIAEVGEDYVIFETEGVEIKRLKSE